MKILHLSTYDTYGGAAKAAHRLHVGLRRSGVNSRMFVRRTYDVTPHVDWPRGFVRQAALRVWRRVDRGIARRAGWTANGTFSPGLIGWPLSGAISKFDPDVLHLHWINDGFVDVTALAAFGRPIVWTLHDMWAFTGGCHYAGDCRRFEEACGTCPLLGATKVDDLSRRVWSRKLRAYQKLCVLPIAPSRWLAIAARTSSLLRNLHIRTIPYGIDTAPFAPQDPIDARKRLGLSIGKRLVVAGASRFREDFRKGFDAFRQLTVQLSGLNRSLYTFATFGTNPPGPIHTDGPEIIELGAIKSEQLLASIYAAADIFVAPSREDNLPNTVIESIACGTPVAAFAIGGIPEMIEDGVTGCLAAPFDIEELSRKIHKLLADRDGLAAARRASRTKAATEFSLETMTQRYRAIYTEILAGR